MTARILVADDDPVLRDFIARGMRERGYLTVAVSTVGEALETARTQPFDVWILDRRMPGGDAVEALRMLRAEGRATPALFLTASQTLDQRVEGFDAGADDYVAKPFSLVELAARVRALLRRGVAVQDDVVRRGDLELRLDARRVLVRGREVAVTANEWRLLALLARRPGVVFTREQIMGEVGVADDAGAVAVDHLVSRLRQKLRESGLADAIQTVRGFGFAWAATP